MPLLFARSSVVACTPVSSIFRHRNARDNAFTKALSTRGRGAYSTPSGVRTIFRPPRFSRVGNGPALRMHHPSISTSASQFTGASKGIAMAMDERACAPASGPLSSRIGSE